MKEFSKYVGLDVHKETISVSVADSACLGGELRFVGTYPNKPEIIANGQFQIQIVDTPKTVETHVSIGFAGFTYQFNRTLVMVS